MDKTVKKIWIAFIVFGLVFAIIPTFISNYYISNKYTLEVEATITRIETRYDSVDEEYEHTVYVSYEIDGELYNTRLNSYSSNYFEGKKLTLLVDPNKRSDAIDKGMRNLVPIIFSIIGSTFALIGIIGMVVITKNKRKVERLRMSGSTIVADYEGTQINTTYSVNGRHPYNVYCSWIDPDTQQKYTFKSENVWKDISHEIEGRHIDKFRVFVNPNNYSEYLVDIDNIKNDLM